MRRLPGGSSTPSWGVVTAARTYAVRLFSDEADASGQARLLRYLAQQGFPVPEVVFTRTGGGQHLLALGWVAGVTLAEALQPCPERADALGRRCGAVHARLHVLPVPPEAHAALPVVTPLHPGESAALLHLDFHLLNVMTDGEEVTGVIDWENVRLGGPRFDVARTLSILCADPAIRALPRAARETVRQFRRGYVAGYAEVAGPGALAALEPCLAWAGRFMLRDLRGRCDARSAARIERWAGRWRHR